MKRMAVRYKIKPEQAAKNEELVRAVYEELHKAQPAGLRYATFKLDDGVTFLHLVSYEEPDVRNALTGLKSFKQFLENIDDRYDEPAVTSELNEIGSYRTFAE